MTVESTKGEIPRLSRAELQAQFRNRHEEQSLRHTLTRISSDRYQKQLALSTNQRNYRTSARSIRASTGYYDDDVTMRNRYSYEGHCKTSADDDDDRPLHLRRRDGFKRLCLRAQSADRRPRSMRLLRTEAERAARANQTAEPREMFKLWSQQAHSEYASVDVMQLQRADSLRQSLNRAQTATSRVTGAGYGQVKISKRRVSVAGGELLSTRGQLYFSQTSKERSQSVPQQLNLSNSSSKAHRHASLNSCFN